MATNDQHNDALLTERNTEALSTNKGDKAGVPNQGKQYNHVNQDAKTVFRKTVPAREQMVTDKAVIATDKDDNPRAVPDDAKTVFRKPISQSKAEEIAQSVAKAKASAKKLQQLLMKRIAQIKQSLPQERLSSRQLKLAQASSMPIKLFLRRVYQHKLLSQHLMMQPDLAQVAFHRTRPLHQMMPKAAPVI